MKHEEGSHVLAMPYLLSNFVLGPVFFECGKTLCTMWAPAPSKPAPKVGPDHPDVMMVKRIVAAANFCILAIEYNTNGLWGSSVAKADGAT